MSRRQQDSPRVSELIGFFERLSSPLGDSSPSKSPSQNYFDSPSSVYSNTFHIKTPRRKLIDDLLLNITIHSTDSPNEFNMSSNENMINDSINESFELINAETEEIPASEPVNSLVVQKKGERDCRTDSSYFSNDEDELEDGTGRVDSSEMGLDSSYELTGEFRVLSPRSPEKMPIYENITINFNKREGERIIELQRHNEHRESVKSFKEIQFKIDNNRRPSGCKTKKDYIIEELLKTEESYIKNLEHICKNYIEYMKEKDVINYKDIFGNIENIYLETEIFYADLIVCEDNHEEIGNTFIRHKNLFNRYPSYCKNKKRSQKMMLEKYYSDLITEREETLEDHLDLSSYLLAPIQRLAKYEQLLKNLYKHLNQNDVGTDNLEAAILLIQRISRTSNDIIILDLIENNEFSLNSTGEFIEMESFRMHSPKKMDAVLFMFQKVIIITAQNLKDPEKYIYKSHIPVDALSRKSEPDSLCFTLENFYKRKKHNEPQYVFEARTLKIKKDWIEKIEKILWEQLYKYKDEAQKNFGSPRKNCDKSKLTDQTLENCES